MKSSPDIVAKLSRSLQLALWMLDEKQLRVHRETIKELDLRAEGWRNWQVVANRNLRDLRNGSRQRATVQALFAEKAATETVVPLALSAAAVKSIGDVLESVGIDRREIPTVLLTNAIETVEGVGFDDAFVAESYIYPSRRAAARGAEMLHAKYPGSDGHTLRFREADCVVSRWFPNRRQSIRN